MRGEAGEAGLRPFEVAKHRVAEDLVAAARLAARLRAGLRPGRRQVHQLFGVRHRQRPQQHLVEQRENRRIRANSERQRQDRDQGDERRLEQGAERQLEIGHTRAFDENTGLRVCKSTKDCAAMVKTYGLTHVAVAVRDLDRTQAFYSGILGAVVVYRDAGFLQMQTPGSRDVLVFEKNEKKAGKAGGVLHFGFRLTKEKDIDAARDGREEGRRQDYRYRRIHSRRAVSVRRRSRRLHDRDLVRDPDAGGSQDD